MTYRDLLRLPQWQKRRLERLQVAGWACEKCSAANRELHVHHKQYFRGRQPWEYADDELDVLCDGCHADEHGKPRARPARRSARAVMRQPVDRVAWMLLRELGWWRRIGEAEHDLLCALSGWHGEFFRWLRDATAGSCAAGAVDDQPWWDDACALIEGEDPAIEPLPEDLPRSIAQLIEAPRREHFMRILGQM